MISVEEAITRVLAAVRPLPPVNLPLASAANGFSAQDLKSALDLPPFDNSAMDGYAVRADDLKSASAQNKVVLRLQGRVTAGEPSIETIAPKACIRLFTGSKLPPGCDAVVMQEDVAATPLEVWFQEPVKPLENVRLQGEDLRAGSLILRAHEKLTPGRLALLAATGHAEARVHGRSTIALLATGNEIRDPGEPLRPGEIYESNRTMLQTWLADLEAGTLPQPRARDTLDDTVAALESSFAKADAVISTGGVSVGEFDFVKEAFQKLGGTLELWRIAMRPGKPFVFGRLGEKLFFGLPGNPVSALVTFLLLVRPAILKMHGSTDLQLPVLAGELAEGIANRSDRRHFARIYRHQGKIHLAGPQKSHMITSLGQANGLLDVPPGAEYPAGTLVNTLLWELPREF